MIDRISGTIVEKNENSVIIQIGGIAFEVSISYNTYLQLPQNGCRCELLTCLVWREDGPQIFGFITEHERILFKQLIKVEKVGPKLALAILSSVSTNELINMVITEDIYSFRAIKGVGDKLASRIILELKDSLSKIDIFKQVYAENNKTIINNSSGTAKSKKNNFVYELEAKQALLNLGFTSKEIDNIFSELSNENIDKSTELTQLIKLALQKTQVK